MNLILLEPSEVSGGRVVLDGRRGEHVLSVIRPAAGDSLRVGLVGGNKGTATVVELGASFVTLELGELVEPPRIWRTRLVLAVPRPKALARVLAAAASLGVAGIDLINAWRVEKSYFGSPALGAEALAAAVRLGCEQGATTLLPKVVVHRRFMLWLESLAPPAPPATEVRLVAHPRRDATLATLSPLGQREVILCIGPEGGWIEPELRSLDGAGFRAVSIGDTIVRVETAVASALGQLSLLRQL